MRHHAAIKWEARLDKVMRELDAYLEEKYKGEYILHPARPVQGETANPSYDGLFSIHANFTLGLGSKIGKGYAVDVKLMTLQHVPDDVRDEIENVAQEKLEDLLPKYFPEIELHIDQDGPVLKIHGDLSLGNV